MRTKALLAGDIRFQLKYGFYSLYAIFTVLYLGLLYALPVSWREKAAILMIFSDPAAMGLYFMGAIVLFEKGERVQDSLAVSPMLPGEYVMAKLVSIAVISTAVGLLVGLGGGMAKYRGFTGVFLGSCLFSAVGLIIAVNIGSLNQFIVATIPAEILISIPPVVWLFGWRPGWLILHPGICIIELCQNGEKSLVAGVVLAVWTALAGYLAVRETAKSLKALGGVKL
jgi:fluoroquinolone transport system permease protein